MKDFKGQEDCAGVLMLLVFFFSEALIPLPIRSQLTYFFWVENCLLLEEEKSHPLLSALLVSYKKCGTERFFVDLMFAFYDRTACDLPHMNYKPQINQIREILSIKNQASSSTRLFNIGKGLYFISLVS